MPGVSVLFDTSEDLLGTSTQVQRIVAFYGLKKTEQPRSLIGHSS